MKICHHHSLNFIRLLRVVITPSVERRKRLEAIEWISGYHHQGCNEIGVVIATKWLHYGNLTKSFTGTFFSNTVASMFVKFKQNLKSVIEIFCNEVFIIRNTVRKGKSWFLAVICRKRSAFDLQFHLIVVLIFLKTCVKDRGDSSAWLLESKEGFD